MGPGEAPREIFKLSKYYFVFQHPSGRGSRLLIDINLIWRLALIEWMVDGLNKIGVLLCCVCSVTVGLVSEAQNWEMTGLSGCPLPCGQCPVPPFTQSPHCVQQFRDVSSE